MFSFPGACSSSIRARPMFLLWFKAHNALPRACSHIHAWNGKGHFLFCSVDDSAAAESSSQPNAGVNSSFLCAVCFDPGPLDSDPSWFFRSSHLIREHFTSGERKLTSWQQKENRRRLAQKNYFWILLIPQTWDKMYTMQQLTILITIQQSNIQGVVEYIHGFLSYHLIL